MQSDYRELGQYIPAHYHANMLNDTVRMQGFREAIDKLVPMGGLVVELGGGTGVLSHFAAQRAEKVWCVEFNPELVQTARRVLDQNLHGDRVEVVHANALEWLPPVPVDTVICEMMHTGLLREQQAAVIHSFKQRYLDKFGGPLPAFIPEACLQAVQAIEHDFVHEGFLAPCLQFQEALAVQPRSRELSDPTVFQAFQWDGNIPTQCAFNGSFPINHTGHVNALRLITKNILAIVEEEQRTIDWHNHYMIIPLASPLQVDAGDHLAVSFEYEPGAQINALNDSLVVFRQPVAVPA